MKKLSQLLVIAIIAIFAFSCIKKEAEKDKNGKTPIQLLDKYVKACQSNDYKTIKDMMTPEYYKQESRRFDKSLSAFDNFKKNHLKSKPTMKSYEVNEKNCEFLKKPSHVYRVSFKAFYTDEYMKKTSDKRFDHYRTGIFFMLKDGEWKLTDMIKGL